MRTGHRRRVRGGLRLWDWGMEIIIDMNKISLYLCITTKRFYIEHC